MADIAAALRSASAVAYLLVAALILLFLQEFVKARNGRARLLLILVFLSWAMTGVEAFAHYAVAMYYPGILDAYRVVRFSLPVVQVALLVWLNVETRRGKDAG